MYIKNLSDEDFTLNINEASILLPANEVSYLDEKQISFEKLKSIYGKYIVELPNATGVEDKYVDLKQTELEAESVYAVLGHMKGQAQVSCMSGTTNIYVSDNTEEPASKTDMKELITSLSGIQKIDILPKYILASSTGATVTNLILKKLS